MKRYGSSIDTDSHTACISAAVSVSTCLSCHARLERVPSHLATHCSIRICISGLGSVAFPVLLTWRLHQQQLLGRFNPRVMVNRAVAFLLHSGPVTGEERWEEASGYSPSTLAVIISAFICAASFAHRTGQRNGSFSGELCRLPESPCRGV